MRIIDINTAIGGPTKSDRFRDAEGLLRWMDDYRIEQALAYHAEFLRSPWFGNEEILRIAGESNGRIKPCIGLNPSLMAECMPGSGSLIERLKVNRPSAVRIFPTNNDYPFDPFYARDMLEVLNSAQLPVIVDAQYDRPFFTALADVAAAYPQTPLILLRWGLNHSRTINPLLKYSKNVYFDMSMMVDVYQIEEIVANYGSERLLFGSGLPYYEPSGPLALLIYADISARDRENIAHANFERLEAEIRYDV